MSRLDGKFIKPKTITAEKLADTLLEKFVAATWGTPGTEADDKMAVTLQLKDLLGDDLVGTERIRLTCTTGATMALVAAGNGTVLSGDGTDDMVIETDGTTGSFDLEVTFDQAGTIRIVAGATQGSGLVSCKEFVDLVFA